MDYFEKYFVLKINITVLLGDKVAAVNIGLNLKVVALWVLYDTV